VRGAQALLDPTEVDGRRGGGGGAEALAIDAATEGVVLQEVETRCALRAGCR